MTAPDPVRAGRALGGAAAAILLLEGIAVLFVPRGIAPSGPGLTGGRLAYLIVLAMLLLLASGLQRRPQVGRHDREPAGVLLIRGLGVQVPRGAHLIKASTWCFLPGRGLLRFFRS